MTGPDPFETKLRSYLRERTRRASDPAAADRLVDRVALGDHRRNRLAPLAAVAIALAVVVLVGAPATLILLQRASHPSSPPQPKIPPPSSTPATTPPPSSTAAVVRVADIAFADALHGWAVGSACVESTQMCNVLVDSSADGGVTWTPAITLGQLSENASTGNAYPISLGVRAEGTNVWVAAGAAGIYESHDAGKSWVHSYTSPVVAIAAGSTTAWAIAGCADVGSSCVLYSSPVGSNAWTPTANQPSIRSGSGGPTWIPLLEVAPNGAVFVVDRSAQPASPAQLLLTTDGGHSWLHYELPCTVGVVGLQTSDGKTLWALCGGGGGAGGGPKAVYVSGDSGVTWQERANNIATPPVGSIAFGGYASSLALTEQNVALVGSQRAGILRSADGGRIWTAVGSHTTCLLDGNGVVKLRFLPSGDGWALEENDNGDPQCPLVARTTDGGLTWLPGGAPLGWSPNQGN